MARNRTPRFMNLFSPERRSARTDRWRKRFRKFSLSTWHSSRIVETVCSVFRSGAEAARAVSAATGSQVVSAASSRSLRMEGLEDRRVLSAVSLTGATYTQDFISLDSVTATSSTTSPLPPGWLFSEVGGTALTQTQYGVSNGGGTGGGTGNTYSYGMPGEMERAFGGLQSGSLIPTIGASFQNNSAGGIESLTISYTGEQWRLGATGRVDRLDFQYSLDATSLTTGVWTDVNALDFTAPITSLISGATSGALDGNAAANRSIVSGTISGLNIPVLGTIFIRWNDLNASGADDGLAVDDFSITSTAANATPTANSQSIAVDEDAEATGMLTGSDAETASNLLTFAKVDGQGPTHGIVTIQPNGEFTYTPTGDYHGPDSFAFTASDGVLTSLPATVSITVNSVNDAPTLALPTSAIVAENTAVFLSDLSSLVTDVETSAGGITFSVTGPDAARGGWFEAGNALRFLDPLPDFEAPSSATGANVYEFLVTAHDANGGSSAAMPISVTVTDVLEVVDSVTATVVGNNLIVTILDGQNHNIEFRYGAGGGPHVKVFDGSTLEGEFDDLDFTGTIIVTGGTGNDNFTVTGTFSDMTTRDLTINGGDGDDTLRATANYSDMSSADVTNITFNGQGGFDTLEMASLNFTKIKYEYNDPSSGKVSYSDLSLTKTVGVTYTGLEPITNTGTVVDAEFILTAGADDATLTALGGGMYRLSGSTFETTDFMLPTGSLTISGAGDDDELTIVDDIGAPTLDMEFDFETINVGANLTGTLAGGTNTNLVKVVDDDAEIADALALVADDGTVTIAAGTYVGALSIAQDVTIDGAGDSLVTIDADGANTGVDVASGFTVSIDGVKVNDFSSTGVKTQGDLTLTGSTVDGGLIGVWVDGGTLDMQSTVVTNAVIFGVQVANGGQADISTSEISGTGTTAAGVIVSDGNANIELTKLTFNSRGLLVNATGTATVTLSDLSSNTIGGVVNATAAVVDASGNWWGSNNETAVDAAAIGAVDFTPFLNAGDTNLLARGFQADTSLLNVTTLGGQSGSTGRIQEGVDLVDVSGTVSVRDGVYGETVLVNKTATLQSTNLHGAQIKPTTGSQQTVVRIDAENVVVDGFAIQVNQNDDGLIGGTAPIAPVGIGAVGTIMDGLVLSDNMITSIGNNASVNWTGGPPSTLTVRAAGIVLNDAPSGNLPSVTLTNNNVSILSGASFFQRGVWLSQVNADITGNTLAGFANDLIFQFASGGPSLIQSNNFAGVHFFTGGGVVIGDPNGSSPVSIIGNTFAPLATASPSTSLLVNRNVNGATSPINIQGNVFSGYTVAGVDVGGAGGVSVSANTFTPKAGAVGFTSIVVDSQSASNNASTASPVDTLIFSNIFNTGGGTGTAILAENNLVGATYAAGGVQIGVGGANTYNGAHTTGVRVLGGVANVDDNIVGAGTGLSVAGGSVTLAGSALTGNTTGVSVTGPGVLTIGSGNTISGGTTGVLLSGAGIGLTGLTFNDISIDASGDYITLANTAFDNLDLDASGTTLGGVDVDGILTTPAQLFAISNRITDEIDNNTLGLVILQAGTIFVTPTATPTAADNDYTRIANALGAANAGDTILLGKNGSDGTFNWDETFALASWELGNDNTAGTDDDWGAMLPAGLNNVTVTAALADGIAIQGDGDLASTSFETGFLAYGNGTNTGWTFSNFGIADIDTAIGFYYQGADDYSGLTVDSMTISIPADNDVEPNDFQNLGIYYSFGQNITISNNTIIVDASVPLGSGTDTNTVAIQSSTHGGAFYDGLSITGNVITVTGSGASIVGIWENGHAHGSDVTVLGNTFNGAGDPTTNDQTAFLITSHSGASTTVAYSGNTIDNASVGFEWLDEYFDGFVFVPQDYTGTQAVLLTGNTLTDVNTGVSVGGINASALLSGNSLTNSGALAGVGVGVDVLASASATIDGSPSENTITGFATGVQSAGTVTVVDNDASIHGNAVGVDVTAGTATISNNHIYDNTIGVRFATTGGGSLTNNNFDDGTPGDGLDDNATDLVIAATAGAVTIGAGNDFAGDTFFIDNQIAQSYDLSANGTTFDETNNFRIEDKMRHGPDNGTSGVIYWVADTLFVTAPGTGASNELLQNAIDVAQAGDTILIETGTYTDSAQIVVDKDLTITGAGDAATIFNKNFDTAAVGDGRGWWLVNDGVALTLSDVKFDGAGQLTWQAIRHKGKGSIDDVAFTQIKYNESGGDYAGTAVAYFAAAGGNLDVTNSTFSQIGRVGVLYFGNGAGGPAVTGTFQGNTYTGKGAGNWLDYGLEVSGGAQVDVIANTISNNLGVALVDSSTSAGVLVTTFFDDGSEAHFTGANAITGNSFGVAAGFDSTDTSVITIVGGSFSNNDEAGVLILGDAAASLSVLNATVTGNGTGISVSGAQAKIQGSNLTGNDVGIFVEEDALVDAGGGSLGSTGFNVLAGYTGASGNYAIENRNEDAVGNTNVFAQNNSFGSVIPAVIEQVVFHTVDDVQFTEVFFTPAIAPPITPFPPMVVFVDDDWTGTALGADADGAGGTRGDGQAFGYDQFATIQDAINAVTGDGTGVVYVYAGSYEENVVINKSLDLIGINDAFAGNDPGRGAESIIDAGSGDVVAVFADDVLVDGFTLQNGGTGVYVEASNNVEIRDNVISGVQFATFYDSAADGSNTGGVVADNFVDNLIGAQTYGLVSFNASYVSVTDNVINADVGVFEQYFYPPNGVANSANVISGNTFNAVLLGYGTNERAVDAAATALSGNTYNIAAGGTGVQLYNIYKTNGVTLTNETINLAGAGVGVYAFVSGGSVSITGGSIDGNDASGSIGVHLTNYLTDFTYAATANGAVTIDGVDISDFGVGVHVEDDALGAFAVHATITNDADITSSGTAILVSGADASVDVINNDNSISGNLVGVDVNGGSATVTNNHIFDNGVGVQFRNGGTGSVTNNNFNDGTADPSPDNDTDVLVQASAGTVTLGDGNDFAGDDYFIENLSTQDFNLVPLTLTTYEGSTPGTFPGNFRIEDQMFHGPDNGTSGVVTWVAGELFVTTNGTGANNETIQNAINVADADDTISIEAGSYSENLTIGKDINLAGVGAVTLSPAAGGNLVTIDGSGFGDDQTVSIANIDFNGSAGLAGYGIRVNDTASFANLTVDDSSFTGFGSNAIAVFGNSTTGISVADVDVSDSTFVDNGIAGGNGSGDLQFFLYNGNATLTNLDLSNTGADNDAHLGIQFRGVGAQNGTGVLPMGAISLTDVDISGLYVRQMIGLQRYTTAGIALNDVRLGGVGSAITGTFGAALRIDAVGGGTFASSTTIDLNDTYFRGVAGLGLDIEIAPDGFGFLRADATDTRWDTTLSVGQTPDNLTLAEQYQLENRILHFVDGTHPNPLFGTFDGFVETVEGNAYITTTQNGNIQRGVDVVDLLGTVNVAAGTYAQTVSVGRTVTLEGAGKGIDADGRAIPESIVNGSSITATISMTADNVVLDGFTVSDNAAGAGVYTAPTASGYQIRNNIVEDNVFGLYINSNGAPSTVVARNLFQNNDAPGAASGNGIYSDQGLSNVTIEDNKFAGNNFNAGVILLGFPVVPITGATIRDNQFVDGNQAVLFNADGAIIDDNDFSGSLPSPNTDSTGTAVFVGGGSDGVQITGNTFTDRGWRAISVVDAGFGYGANSNVTITGNTVNQNVAALTASSPQTGLALISLTDVGGVSLVDDNDVTIIGTMIDDVITAGVTFLHGIAVAGGGAGGTVTVSNNTLDGNDVDFGSNVDDSIGIRVTADGDVRVLSNSVTGFVVGADVDDATALVQGSNVNGNTIGVRIQNGGVADLGQVGPGVDYTGLGVSTGGNDFAGYTTVATASAGAIVNLNANGLNANPGRQGAPPDVTAFGNLWAINTPNGIEDVVYHDSDDGSLGFVDFAAFGNLSVAVDDDDISEGDEIEVTGSFTNVPQAHTVTIVWNDGSPDTVINLAAGVFDFDATHIYEDDADGPTENTTSYPITVTVTEVATMQDVADSSLSVDVSNVAPTVTLVGPTTADDGETLSFTFTTSDPGADTFPLAGLVLSGGAYGVVSNVAYNPLTGGGSFDVTFDGPPGSSMSTVSVTVEDDDEAAGVDTIVVTIEDTLRVLSTTVTPSGIEVVFNRTPNLADLNLYDGLDAVVDLPDLTLVRNGVETIVGSMAWNSATNTLSFVKTGGVLADGNYTLTLESGAVNFHDAFGNLDGNGNFNDTELNDDFTTSFVVAPSTARVVSIRDFARGTDQHIDDVPEAPLPRLAVSVDNANQVRSLDFHFRYDPALFRVLGASLDSAIPNDWSITVNNTTPGLLIVTASGATALTGSNVPVVLIDAEVPDTALYGDSEVLKLVNTAISVQSGLLTVPTTSRGDYAIHKNVFLGDADGNANYTGFDSALISRVAALLDTGFDAHDWTDPVIVADVDRNGLVQGGDASIVAQRTVNLPTPQLPPLPMAAPPVVATGVDPELSIADNIIAAAGADVVVPVKITIEPNTTVFSATYNVTYDTNLLTFVSSDQGVDFAGWSLFVNESPSGTVNVTMFNANGFGTGGSAETLELTQLTFDVAASLIGMGAGLDVEPVDPNEGGLVWTDSDGSVFGTYTADFDLDGDVDGGDLGDWQAGFGTSPNATVGQGDEDRDGDVDGSDFLAWQRQLGSAVIATVAAGGNSAPMNSLSAVGAEAAAVSVDAVADSESSALQTAWLESPSISHHRSASPAHSRDADAAFQDWSAGYDSAASPVAVVDAEDESDEFASIEDLYQDQDDSESFGNEFDEALLSWLEG